MFIFVGKAFFCVRAYQRTINFVTSKYPRNDLIVLISLSHVELLKPFRSNSPGK